MIYEYAPKFKKKKEKYLCLALLAVGLVIFFCSMIPNAPAPGVMQTVGVAFLAVMLLIYSLYLSRSYVYSVRENEDGGADFLITEHYGRRTTVVCRVYVTSVISATPRNEETKKKYKEMKKGKAAYVYTGVLFDEAQYELHIVENGEEILLRICADGELIRILTAH